MRLSLSLCLLSLLLGATVAQAGVAVRVTVHGTVDFNSINNGVLKDVAPAEAASMTFLLDTDDFVDSTSFPTRGYVIDQPSFTLDFASVSAALKNPFPENQTPYFVIRNNDPGVDGFLLTNNVNNPFGVALNVPAIFGPLIDNFYVTYGASLLPSLDLLDAVGSYDFTGLSVFNWTLDDGGFNAMGLIFSDMTIALENDPWVDLGNALAGVNGEPALVGTGPLTPGSLNALTLSNAAPSAPLGLFFSTSSAPVPFKGGTLVASPFLGPVVLSTEPLGGLALPFVLPPSAPSGLDLFLQAVVQDGAAVNGFALSNAVQGTVP